MKQAELRWLADLLLPGDPQGLPPGSLIPEVMLALGGSVSPIKPLILSHPDFADEAKRQSVLTAMEQAHGQAFRDFVLSLIKPYYESAPVLEAMGWRSAPPQPKGHNIAAMDDALAPALARIAERKRIWR
jgi:hypothetical protein